MRGLKDPSSELGLPAICSDSSTSQFDVELRSTHGECGLDFPQTGDAHTFQAVEHVR
jgi:hypothetical protein